MDAHEGPCLRVMQILNDKSKRRVQVVTPFIPNILQLPVERAHAITKSVKRETLQPTVMLRFNLNGFRLMELG